MNLEEKVDRSDYQELIEIWEAAVRATHDFLKEEDIQYFKPLILEKYFDAVNLSVIKDEDEKILGFSGVAENNLEMLFIHPARFGSGIGSRLLKHAINKFSITQLDVNEENVQALNFYTNKGFKVTDRSEKDTTGKPYPILHMQLEDAM